MALVTMLDEHRPNLLLEKLDAGGRARGGGNRTALGNFRPHRTATFGPDRDGQYPQ
jgi:hypothetical protein